MKGALRGFFRGAFGLLGWAAGVGASLFYWQMAGRAMASRWGIGSLVAYGLAFFLLFLGPFLVLRLLGSMFRRLSKVVFLGGADRLAGAILGAATGSLVVGGALSLLASTRWGQTLVDHSAVARPLVSVFRQLLRQAGV